MLAVFFAGLNLLVGVDLFARRLALVIGVLFVRRFACAVGVLIVVVVVVGLRDVVLEYGTLRARRIARRGLDALDLVQVVLFGIRLFHFVYIYLRIRRLDVFAHGAPICVRGHGAPCNRFVQSYTRARTPDVGDVSPFVLFGGFFGTRCANAQLH